jgi:hypothetical protein
MTNEIYTVVGVTFENRQDILNNFYKTYQHGSVHEVFLYKEDDNIYDKNAISVNIEVDGKVEKVGYISKDKNKELRNKFNEIKNTKVKSIGPNINGDIGLSIIIEF